MGIYGKPLSDVRGSAIALHWNSLTEPPVPEPAAVILSGMNNPGPAAVIIGASSGIGEALARELHQRGWRLGLLARRLDRLNLLAAELGPDVLVGYLDVSAPDCVDGFNAMAEHLGGADLVIISAGTGHLNPKHEAGPDEETVSVNVLGFMAMAREAFLYFQRRGHGHLAAITSVASLRGNHEGAIYAASKAFQSTYLDGLRASAQALKLPIGVTELQPGFVDTAMMKTAAPLTPLVRRLFVCDAPTAARQMLQAIYSNRKHAYITKRYALVAAVLKLLPRPGKKVAPTRS
jgi:short-subunit dehydrogenase